MREASAERFGTTTPKLTGIFRTGKNGIVTYRRRNQGQKHMYLVYVPWKAMQRDFKGLGANARQHPQGGQSSISDCERN